MILLFQSRLVLVKVILGDDRLVEISDSCHGSASMLSELNNPSHPPPPSVNPYHLLFFPSYLVTNLMGADLNNIVKFQRLSDEHVQFLIYQLLRGLKVICTKVHLPYIILQILKPFDFMSKVNTGCLQSYSLMFCCASVRSVRQPARPAVQPLWMPWGRQKRGPFRQGLICWTALLTSVSLYVPRSLLPHAPAPPHFPSNSTSIQQDWSTEWVAFSLHFLSLWPSSLRKH